MRFCAPVLEVPLIAPRLTLLAVCLATAAPSAAQEPVADSLLARIDSMVAARMLDARIPGGALVILHGDRVRHVRGFGVADDSGRPVTSETPFTIGSVTKSFTALAVMQLVEAGRVELDAPIQRYIPWFRVADPEASSQITVRHLLSHTSGLSTLDGNRRRGGRDATDEALTRRVRALARARPRAPPGTRFEYSNGNYQTLGLLVEVVSGQAYEDYVQERIFAPLGMNAGFASTPRWLPDGVARGYRYWFGRPVAGPRTVEDRQVLPQGLITASADGMARYVSMLMNGGEAPGARVLSPESVAELHKPAINTGGNASYAMGWRVTERDGRREIGHTGFNPGFDAVVWMVPEQKLGLVLLLNAWHSSGGGVPSIFPALRSLLSGQEPPPVRLVSRGRVIMGVAGAVLLAAAISAVLTIRRWRRLRSGRTARSGGAVRFALRLLMPLLFFGGIAYVLLVRLWHSQGATLAVGFQFAPDVAWVAALAGVITLAWAIVHTALVLLERRRPPVAGTIPSVEPVEV